MPVPFKQRAAGQWVTFAQAALLIILCWLSARLFWTIVTPVGPVGDGLASISRPVDTAVVGRFDPFFRSPAVAAGASQVSARQLTLLGTRVDTVSGRGSAIIATADGTQASYLVGEDIEPGLRLQAVGFDEVTLVANGQTETLFLDQSAGGSPITPDDAAIVPLTGGTAPKNPDLADVVAMTPRLRGGTVNGMTLTPRSDGTAFRRLGLQAGDVLLTIDGTSVSSLGNPQSVAARVADRGATLGIERNGTPVTVSVAKP